MANDERAGVVESDTSTCEARNYVCCDLNPPGERADDGWYDRHVAAWEARARD